MVATSDSEKRRDPSLVDEEEEETDEADEVAEAGGDTWCELDFS